MVTPSPQRVGDLLLSAAVVVGAIGFTTAFDTTPEAVEAAVIIALAAAASYLIGAVRGGSRNDRDSGRQ